MTSRGFSFVLLLCAAAFGQVSFDVQSPACGYSFPTPCGGAGDPEGVSFNGALTLDVPAFGATVDVVNGVGMPCGGLQFLRLQCANPAFAIVPNGGPIPEGGTFARFWIPIPAGATAVSFCWDFYAAEPANSAYNDAVAVDFVSGCGGNVLGNLVYADMHTSGFAPITDGTPCGVMAYIPAVGVHELAAPSGSSGPQSVILAPLAAGAAFIRVSAANSGDNAVTGQFVMDSVTFAGGAGGCTTVFSSPFGPGSVMMVNTACPASAGRTYLSAIDLTGGSYPAGWFFGLDISLPELINEILVGPPFTGVLDASGFSTTPAFGPAAFLSGLTLFAVTTEWAPGYAAFLGARPSVAYVIP